MKKFLARTISSPAGPRKPWKISRADSGQSSQAERAPRSPPCRRCRAPRGMAARPVEAERRAPVVHDERDVRADIERLEAARRGSAVLDEAVASGRRRELVGVAHADQVGRDAAALVCEVRHHVAPEVRRGRVAVQEDDRRPRSHLDVGHLGVEDGWRDGAGGDRRRRLARSSRRPGRHCASLYRIGAARRGGAPAGGAAYTRD